MPWILGAAKWIMLVSGLLTCTMLYAAIDPRAAMASTFGESIENPAAEIVVRNWGVLIGLVGAMLIYGAFRPAVRPLVLSVAGASKIAFIMLVVLYERVAFGHGAGIAVVTDLIQVSLFVWYSVAAAKSPFVEVHTSLR
jgi:hypothetical protein